MMEWAEEQTTRYERLKRSGEALGYETRTLDGRMLWMRSGKPVVRFLEIASHAVGAKPEESGEPLTIWMGANAERFRPNCQPEDLFLDIDALSETTLPSLLARDESLTVVENLRFPSKAGDQNILAFDAPFLAGSLKHGQFLNISASTHPLHPGYRIMDDADGGSALGEPRMIDHHLARVPLSMLRIYRTESRMPAFEDALPPDIAYMVRPAKADLVSVAVRVVGHGTRALYDANVGDRLSVLGPLGQPERVPDGVRRVVLLAGGVGFAPLCALAEQCHWRKIPTLFLAGARTREHFYPWLDAPDRFIEPELMKMNIGIRVVSEADEGKYATDLLAEYLETDEGRDTDLAYVCGPWPMMAKAAALCAEAGVSCRVFLEKRMECGIGVCMSCVCRRINDDGSWSNARVCREGTVFDAARIKW
jgi:dihydroorotate dehydrogenase electron transfer subunit